MQHACNLFHSFDAKQKLVAETGHCRKGAKLAERKVFHTQVPDMWFGNHPLVRRIRSYGLIAA